METQPDKTLIPTLRDAYKVSGFRVRAKIDNYAEVQHPAFVLTLDRRSKKRCAVDAVKFAEGFTANADGWRAISVVGIGVLVTVVQKVTVARPLKPLGFSRRPGLSR
jgi:hypothetical protein